MPQLLLTPTPNCLSPQTPGRPESIESLCRRLETGSDADRIAAARALGREEPRWALGPLCRALDDSSEAVRREAIAALGELGDPAASGALAEIVREGLVGRSARLHTAVRWILLLLAVGFAVLLALRLGALRVTGVMPAFNLLIMTTILAVYRLRDRKGPLARAAGEALARIAERNPHPALREALPGLRAIAADRGYKDAARESARAAAERIEVLTKDLENLPVAAAAPSLDPSTLPLPAGK